MDSESETLPTFFLIKFLQNESLCCYGLEADWQAVRSERLFVLNQRKELDIFIRQGQEFSYHPIRFKSAKILKNQKFLRPNALLLSSAAITTNPVVTDVMNWFKKFTIISGFKEESHEDFTKYRTLDLEYREEMTEFLKMADFGINEIQVRRLNPYDLPYVMPNRVRKEIITR